jgi:hypothetical protein
MKLRIKKFAVEMDVDDQSIEIEVRTTNSLAKRGQCAITKSGLTWYPTKHGKTVTHLSWPDFAKFMESL